MDHLLSLGLSPPIPRFSFSPLPFCAHIYVTIFPLSLVTTPISFFFHSVLFFGMLSPSLLGLGFCFIPVYALTSPSPPLFSVPNLWSPCFTLTTSFSIPFFRRLFCFLRDPLLSTFCPSVFVHPISYREVPSDTPFSLPGSRHWPPPPLPPPPVQP